MILGYSVERQRSDGSFYVYESVWIANKITRIKAKEKAKQIADNVGGIVTPIGVLSEPEMLLELKENNS